MCMSDRALNRPTLFQPTRDSAAALRQEMHDDHGRAFVLPRLQQRNGSTPLTSLVLR